MKLLAAKQAGVSLAHEVGAEQRSVWELLKSGLDCEDDLMSEVLGQRREKQEKMVQDFIHKASAEVAGDFEICGYDPMNMFKVGNWIYGSNFFALRVTGEKGIDCAHAGVQQDEIMKLFGETVLWTDETGRVKKYYVK